MSTLNNNDFHTPLAKVSQEKLRGHMLRGRSEQAAAATAAGGAMVGATPLTQRSNKFKLQLFVARLAAAGESLTVDVLRAPVAGGAAASILTAPYVYDSTKQLGWIDLPVAAGVVLNAGDVITVSRTYAAGGGPTPIGPNVVQLEPS